ncbi:MAG: hypothetical protein HOE93_03155 [Nitrosopumilus sp.]|jgi:hypothetical protein|nr:hypothetical protein [Nitrosopumilus sp.]MBT3573990.1 hypothetical protein [Nitrosopumilus sp.]MBT3861672.1 hypothetical protein [Nitrosopumilus sp.]MBT3956296.1 hypothetical protein [Nitrosopumilus sp.]MBT4298929.1 hypothetical protein [Nitrosopumilus sp.]
MVIILKENILQKLIYLNQLKKENKETRKLQNKRYREKHRSILNLKKRLSYQKKKYLTKLNSI